MTEVTNGAISRTFMQKREVEEKAEEGRRRTQSERWRRGGLKRKAPKVLFTCFCPAHDSKRHTG